MANWPKDSSTNQADTGKTPLRGRRSTLAVKHELTAKHTNTICYGRWDHAQN